LSYCFVRFLLGAFHFFKCILKSGALLEYPCYILEKLDRDYDHGGSMFSSKDIKNNIESVYNRFAGRRDSADRPEWKNAERIYALDYFRDHECRSLLEIGAGTGQDSLFFKENGLAVHAIDLSGEHVKCCLEKGIPASVMDLYKMDFPTGHFDCVYSMNCFLHVPKRDLTPALEETKRVLSPGGLFYLGVYGGREYEGYLKWTDYSNVERFFSFYMFDEYMSILERLYTIVDAREIYLSDELIFNAFLLRK